MSTVEGCATISDTAGNLLFYTNGLTVWNKNHQVMENGSGLLGRESSTQGALIVPWPENDSLYYIFTTHGRGSIQTGFRYHIVNLNENGGLGKVISKNNELVDVVCEKLTATHHANGRDIWVLVHGFPNDSFYAYLVTEQGLIDCPVVTEIGSVHGIPNQFGQIDVTDAQGAMKFNIDGSLLAVTVFGLNKIELFAFHKSKGKIEYKASAIGIFLPYGVEFSPNSKFLYCTDKGFSLSQFQLTHWDNDSITNSRKFLANYSNEVFNQLQLASNGIIYVSKDPPPYYPYDTLGQIMNPDLEYPACNYVDSVVSLQKNALLGLPNFITSYFRKETKEIRYALNCAADSGKFFGYSLPPVGSWAWELKNRQGMLIGSAYLQNATFSFTDSGRYTVRLIADADTLFKEVYIEQPLKISQDTLLCSPSQLVLSIPANFRCLEWQDGSDTNNYRITQSGKYYISAYNLQGCRVSDTVEVQFINLPTPLITRSNDTLFTDSGYTYSWYLNGNLISGNQRFLEVSTNGTYKVEITDSNTCSSFSDNVLVSGLSIHTIESHGFRVYPNPSSESEGISIVGENLINTVEVFDLLGKRVYYKSAINSQKHTIEQLHGGVYILKINESISLKIMIK